MALLDDAFLEDVGLSSMSEADRSDFLAWVSEELELRVGEKLSVGIPDSKLNEFESFMDRDMTRVGDWLEENAPSFMADPLFSKLEASAATQDIYDTLAEYASMAWLRLNCPNYSDIVVQTMEELKSEIRRSAGTLLSGIQQREKRS